MTVTFLAHSGFLVEWDDFYTLFDFYKGELPALDPKKPLLVFSSHSHEDHFDPRIFTEVFARYPNVSYYLSRDIRLTERRREKIGVTDEMFAHVTSLRPDEVLVTEAGGKPLTIRTVKSTDIGSAFLLQSGGKLVFHAGDLNWWHWVSEGKAYCNNMAASYKRAIEKLCAAVESEAFDNGCTPQIDVAMLPLDPRLDDGFGMGIEYLLKCVEVKTVFPMHMWEHFEWIDRYRAEHAQHAEKIMRISHNGQRFEV